MKHVRQLKKTSYSTFCRAIEFRAVHPHSMILSSTYLTQIQMNNGLTKALRQIISLVTMWVFLLQLNSVLNCIQMWLIICERKNVKSNRSEDEIVKLKSFPGYTRYCTSEGRKTQKKTSFRNGRFFCNFFFVCLFCLFENIFVSIWLHSLATAKKKSVCFLHLL